MNALKKWFDRLFIDGLTGMAQGLFVTLIIGTILQQIGTLTGGEIGNFIYNIGKIAAFLTGAGIGCGVAYKMKESPLVVLSAAIAGMVGAFAGKILAGALIVDGAIHLNGSGEPLGALVAAYIGVEAGHIISGRTKVDIVVTPFFSIFCGSGVGLLVGSPISTLMNKLGSILNWGTEQNPLIMGIVIAVLMGMMVTLPINAVAICAIIKISGIAAGAATIGCCVSMVGFAVASYHENKMGGLLAQGLGTSILQISNVVRKPLIWLPVVLTSAILGPVSTCLLKMTNTTIGAGMGTCGLIGQIATYQTMVSERGPVLTLILIALMHFLLPGFLVYTISQYMRKRKWIKMGDMKLNM